MKIEDEIKKILEDTKNRLSEHCDAFIMIVEGTGEDGERFTINEGIGPNSCTIGMCRMLEHDILYARDRRFEEQNREGGD